MTKDKTEYLTEAIPKTFPNINLMPTTANEFKVKQSRYTPWRHFRGEEV
jgi:hypothetical protein